MIISAFTVLQYCMQLKVYFLALHMFVLDWLLFSRMRELPLPVVPLGRVRHPEQASGRRHRICGSHGTTFNDVIIIMLNYGPIL